MSWKKGPFDRYKAGFDLKRQGGEGFARTTTANSPEELGKRASEGNASSQPIELPRHLYTPEGAQTIDIRHVCVVTPGSTEDVLAFTAPQGSVTRFTHYGIFNDGLLESDFVFLPLVDGRRAFPFHGDPADNFRISLGLGPDLTNNSMIEATLALSPTQQIIWRVTNNSLVDVTMGVRMKGYLDFSQRMVQTRFGG